MDDLEHLMNLFKQHRDTYSDTPGMGNMEPWTVQGAYPYEPDEGWVKQQQSTNNTMPYAVPDMGSRMDLERMMLDWHLHKSQRETRIREYMRRGPNGNWSM